jgi:hypothetical protein
MHLVSLNQSMDNNVLIKIEINTQNKQKIKQNLYTKFEKTF